MGLMYLLGYIINRKDSRKGLVISFRIVSVLTKGQKGPVISGSYTYDLT